MSLKYVFNGWQWFIVGAAVVGFAIYYDSKRRSAPDYKDKIRQSMFLHILLMNDFVFFVIV